MTTETTERPATCGDCGGAFEPTEHTPGYGRTAEGAAVCYRCCAIRDYATMRETGKATLYYTPGEHGSPGVVSNWPGSLKFQARHASKGRHNIAGSQTTVWFEDDDAGEWIGKQYGQWSDICRCRRIKA